MTKRMRFFYSHLCASLIIAIIIAGIVLGIWYPFPLSKATGMTHIILMMFVIDVIIGPILGLIVYKEQKKSLKFDLSVVIVLQVLAMSYGVYSLAEGRPVWIVGNGNRFELVRNNEVILQNAAKAQPIYQHTSWLGPQYVSIKYAKDPKIRSQQIFEEVMGGISLSQRPEMYQSLSSVKTTIAKNAKNFSELEQYNEKKEMTQTLANYPQADSFVPLKANAVDMTVLIDKKNGGKVVKIVDLRPWK